ncbi:butyrate kinase [Prolixibacteraceae bacterium JC049]|nr:butyrate kinase [Prolixibacteraceae bacterium JC049]
MEKNEILILAINPGSTSTKFAVFANEQCVLQKTIRHTVEELAVYEKITDQFEFRKALIFDELRRENVELGKIKYVIGRGGLTYPLESGIYEVNDLMLEHLRNSVMGEHASNLGPILAHDIAQHLGNVKAFIADPVVTDEMEDVARYAGHPLFERKSIFHALNQKAIAREHARTVNKNYEEMNLILVHLGGGISVGAHRQGKIIDVNNALNGEGPFTPERSGTLPAGQLVDLCFSGKYTQTEIKRMITGEGGFVAYLGTNDAYTVEKKVAAGDEEFAKVQEAMSYQIAKGIGEMAVVLDGKVDGILITGGMAYDKAMMAQIRTKVEFIAPVFIYPGEDELKALAMNVYWLDRGVIQSRVYDKQG